MNYLLKFLHSLLLMLIFFQLIFSMDGQTSKSLNSGAPEIIPQHQSFLKPIHPFQPLHNNNPNSVKYNDSPYFFTDVPEFHIGSNPIIAREDLEESESHYHLPDDLRKEIGIEKDSIDDNYQESEIGYRGKIVNFNQILEKETPFESKKEKEFKSTDSTQKEEKQEQNVGEDLNKKPIGKYKSKQSSRQRKEKQKQELKKENFGDGEKGIKFSAGATYKEKLLLDKPKSEKSISAINQSSSSSSNIQKGKQASNHESKNLQPDSANISLSNYIQKQKSPKIGVKNKESTMSGLVSRILKETPEGASHAITVTDTGEVDLLDRAKPREDNRYDLLDTHQKREQLEEEEANEDDVHVHVDVHPKEEQSRKRNQKGRHSAKSKRKIVKKEATTLEMEEEEMLRRQIIRAEEERKEENRKKEEEGLKKQTIKNNEKTEKIAYKIRPISAIDSNITNLNLHEQQIEASEAPSSSAQDSTSTISNILKRHEKLKQINNMLEKLQEKLNKIDELEKELNKEKYNWLFQKIDQFRDKNKNRNKNDLNEMEKEIIEQLDKFDKINEFINIDREIKILEENIKTNDNRETVKSQKKILKMKKENYKKLQKKNVEQNLDKRIVELKKLLMKKFIKMNNNEKPETEKMKEIRKQIGEPLKYLWTGYNLVIDILKDHWKTSSANYFFISDVFEKKLSTNDDEKFKFNKTMESALEKMLKHRIDGKLVDDKLNCFNQLSTKFKWLSEYAKTNISGNYADAEHMESYGKYFKKNLNKLLLDALSFIIIGLDHRTEVAYQMVSDGFFEFLKWKWFDKNRRKKFNEILMQFIDYNRVENHILQILSLAEYDKLGEKAFELLPDYFDERLNEQLTINKEFCELIDKSTKLTPELKKLSLVPFDHIKNIIVSINMLLKIEKRMNDEKPLPFLKFVYDKYWYLIYRDRFKFAFLHITQHASQRLYGTEFAEILKRVFGHTIKKAVSIFKQIEPFEPDIEDGMLKILERICEVLNENEIGERGKKYENSKEFLKTLPHSSEIPS